MRVFITNRFLEPTEFEVLSILARSAGMKDEIDYLKYPDLPQSAIISVSMQFIGSTSVKSGFYNENEIISYEEMIGVLKDMIKKRK